MPSLVVMAGSSTDPPCSVPVEPADLPLERFRSAYQRAGLPVVVRNATLMSGRQFRALTSLERLKEDYGTAMVTLSSANANSYGRRRASIADYLRGMSNISWDDAADSIFYLFGEHGEELKPLLEQYPLPRFVESTDPNCKIRSILGPGGPDATPLSACEPPALSFGVAGDGSGVPFHFHNDGFSEVMHGRKRWLLYADRPVTSRARLAAAAARVVGDRLLPKRWPVMRMTDSRAPALFAPNSTTASWLRDELPKLADDEQPLQCVLQPGDLLYFPKGWWHAISNIGTTVFMSTFL